MNRIVYPGLGTWALITLSAATQPILAQDCFFDPFGEVTGWLESGALFDGVNQDGVEVEEWIIDRSESPFQDPTEFNVWDYGAGAVWAGFASNSGTWTQDREPDWVGPCTPAIEAHEWQFTAQAGASGAGGARADGEISFVLTEPVRLLVRAEFQSLASVSLSNVFSAGYGPSSTIVESPLFHDEFVVQPGHYVLGYWTSWSSDDGAIELLFRFEPAKCGPADINADGLTDLADIQGFVTSYLSTSESCDLNADGVLDVADIGLFVEYFLNGC